MELFPTQKSPRTSKGSSFKNAIQNTPRTVLTDNGCDTYESSLSPLVDLFFIIGSSRGKDITRAFEAAYGANPEKALRMLFWVRDIRGGAGERQTFKNLMLHLERNHPRVAEKVIALIPEYGRWDDLLIFTNQRLKNEAFRVVNAGLKNDATKGLCAKWMPRKGYIAKQLREYLGLSPKGYRQMLVSLSNTVETAMCSKDYSNVDYNKLPSMASARYQKAFLKNDAERYQEYKDSLVSTLARASTGKINAGAVYPHDVLKSIHKGDVEVATAQWEALPNYLGDNKIVPVIDVSGSMTWSTIGGSVRPIDVSVSLGLYVADKQTGAFKDVVCHFSGRSRLEVLKGDIVSKINQINRMEWGGNTNIEAAFKEILKVAVTNKVSQEDMPKMLLIMSDMEFDSCTEGTAYDTARHNFHKYGYKLPRVVFWNLNARENNNPVTFKTDGTALISGFSPNILKSVLKGDLENYSPENIMNATIMDSRYDPVGNCYRG